MEGETPTCDVDRSRPFLRNSFVSKARMVDALDQYLGSNVRRVRRETHPLRYNYASIPATTPANLATLPETGGYTVAGRSQRRPRRIGQPARAESPESAGEFIPHSWSAQSYYSGSNLISPHYRATSNHSQGNFTTTYDFPYFNGDCCNEDYLKWEHMVDTFFNYTNILQERQARYVVRKLTGRAKTWWTLMLQARHLEGRSEVKSWRKMKSMLRSQFLTSDVYPNQNSCMHLHKAKEANHYLTDDFNVSTNFEHFRSATDDLLIDEHLEIVEAEMNESKMGDALKLFSWSEDDAEHEEKQIASKIAYSQHQHLVPKVVVEEVEEQEKLQKEIEEITQRAKVALEEIVNVRVSASQPKNISTQSQESKNIKFKPSQYDVDEEVVSERILSLNRSSKVRSTLELYLSMDVVGLGTSAHTCNSLLDCLIQSKLSNDALVVFEKIRKKGLPTGHTFSLVVVASDKGYKLVMEMFTSFDDKGAFKHAFDIVLYNIMISICGKAKNWVDKERMWTNFMQNNLTGTMITYSLLISAFVWCGVPKLALEAYHKMITKGFVPDEDILKAIVASYTKDGKWDLALNIFRKMLESGIKPKLISYNSVINCGGKTGEVVLAFRFYEFIKLFGMTPDVCTWSVPLNIALLASLGGVNYPLKLASSWGGNDPCTGDWLGVFCSGGYCMQVKRLSLNGGFQSLEMLLIRKLEALEEGFNDNAAESGYHQQFPNLQKLHVHQCLKLCELPTLPFNLTRLKLADVGLTKFPGNEHRSNSSLGSSSLTEIEIIGCREITSLPSEEVLGRFTTLQHLEISYCENLSSLGGLQAIHSLKRVAIWNCPNLIQGTSWSPTMEERESETICNMSFMLEQLETNDPLLLLEMPFRSLTSLQILKIVFNNSLISFLVEAENWRYLTMKDNQNIHLGLQFICFPYHLGFFHHTFIVIALNMISGFSSYGEILVMVEIIPTLIFLLNWGMELTKYKCPPISSVDQTFQLWPLGYEDGKVRIAQISTCRVVICTELVLYAITWSSIVDGHYKNEGVVRSKQNFDVLPTKSGVRKLCELTFPPKPGWRTTLLQDFELETSSFKVGGI